MSSIVALAPSTRIFFPDLYAYRAAGTTNAKAYANRGAGPCVKPGGGRCSAEGRREDPHAHLVDVVHGVAHVGVQLLGEFLQHPPPPHVIIRNACSSLLRELRELMSPDGGPHHVIGNLGLLIALDVGEPCLAVRSKLAQGRRKGLGVLRSHP